MKDTSEEGRFLEARDGDHLMTPFQCDLCHFRNIWKRDPDMSTHRDRWKCELVRRANLDALWAREPTTVRANASDVGRLLDIGMLELEMEEILPTMGPFPVRDDFGMKLAICMLVRSLDPGKNEDTIQFSTMRKLRSAYANAWNASERGLAGEPCPSDNYWFKRFMLGAHKRMGDDVRPDFGLSLDLAHALLKNLNRDWHRASYDDWKEKGRVSEFAVILVIGFCLGLRGDEIMKTRSTGFYNFTKVGKLHAKHPHVVFQLMGRFNRETGERCHLMPLAFVTTSGISCGMWIERLMNAWDQQGKEKKGYAFVDPRGRPKKISNYDLEFAQRLEEVKVVRPDLFPSGINITDSYSLVRSLRRGSTSEAENRGIRPAVIEMNNRWRIIEKAKGRQPSLPMRQHYTEVLLMLPTLVEYSYMH